MGKSTEHIDNPNVPKGCSGKKTRRPLDDQKICYGIKLLQLTKSSEQVVDPKITLFLKVGSFQ